MLSMVDCAAADPLRSVTAENAGWETHNNDVLSNCKKNVFPASFSPRYSVDIRSGVDGGAARSARRRAVSFGNSIFSVPQIVERAGLCQ